MKAQQPASSFKKKGVEPMTKPFYLPCECGGELEIDIEWEAAYCIGRCKKQLSLDDLFDRYAAALGVAVEALDKIDGIWEATGYWDMIQPVIDDALKQIRGEKTGEK